MTPQYTHLYYQWDRCWDGCWDVIDGEVRFVGDLPGHTCSEIREMVVTRTTAKRIYFIDNGNRYDPVERFVVRAAIEPTGSVYHREVRKILHLTSPNLHRYDKPVESLADLRKAAADLHPDRGGDPAEFRAAYDRYARAKALRW